MVWAGCGRASSRELQSRHCAQGWRVSSQRPLHAAGGPAAIQGRSGETPRSWFMTIKRHLLLLHWCVLLGQHQAAACGSEMMLAPVEPLCPWLPREMIPVQGHSGQEVALLFVIVPRVLLQRRSLAWVTVQCQVIGVSTELLQPNSLLQNPFSSPVPYQVWFYPRNECIKDGWAGWKQLAGSHRLGMAGWKEAEHHRDRQQPNRNELLLSTALCEITTIIKLPSSSPAMLPNPSGDPANSF